MNKKNDKRDIYTKKNPQIDKKKKKPSVLAQVENVPVKISIHFH